MDRQYPGEKVWRFECSPGNRLGRDGVLQVQGLGLYKIHEFDGDVFLDGIQSDSAEGSFQHSFRAEQASSDKPAKIELHMGRKVLLNPVFWPVPEAVDEFSGWLLSPPGWAFFEPVYTYEGLDPNRPVGAPASSSCYTINSFFLANPQSRSEAKWDSADLTSFYEVESFPAPFVDHGKVRFTVEVPPENKGVQIARLFDFRGLPQQAEVLVNDHEAGVWDYPMLPGDEQVRADLFGLPLSLTEGQTSLTIEIRPLTEWPTTWYGIDALLPRLQ